MKIKIPAFLLCICCIIICACKDGPKKIQKVVTKKTTAIYIQPFNDIKASDVQSVLIELQKVYSPIYLLPSKPLPQSAYTKPRNRYRADSLLRIINKATAANCKTIGLTNKDISTSKKNIADFGVMGLGYTPGKACIVSSFRLNKKFMLHQLYKVAIHELGHTFGLPHCSINTCYMRDADGGNPLNEEVNFCDSCKKYLIEKGWKL